MYLHRSVKFIISLTTLSLFLFSCDNDSGGFKASVAKTASDVAEEPSQNSDDATGDSETSNADIDAQSDQQDENKKEVDFADVKTFEFTNSEITTKSESFEIGYNSVRYDFTLRRDTRRVDASKTFTQTNRPQQEDEFTQGNAGTPATDTYQHKTLGKLDIILVVDNSSDPSETDSMLEEQTKLKNLFEQFMSYTNIADWNMAIVNTNPMSQETNCGLVAGTNLFNSSDMAAGTLFTAAVEGGDGSSFVSSAILTATNVIECSDPSFLRNDSKVAVIILSDKDNCNEDTDCLDTQEFGKAQFLVDALSAKADGRSVGDDMRVYGLLNDPDSPCRQF